MRAWIYVAVALGVATPGEATGLMPPAQLQRIVEAFAGRPALVDPRLLLPDCAAPQPAWAPGSASVVVHCLAPAWRVFVPVPGTPGKAMPIAGAEAAPMVRRGDQVMVEAGGDGFVIGLETVAEADARGDRVALRAAGGGRRLTGIIGIDGRVRINGLSGMVSRR